MLQLEKLSVPLDFSEASERSLQYVLSFAKEISAQFIVLQVIEKNVERYSLIFSVALLERWPVAASSVAAIPVDALQQQKNIDLAGIIQRIMKTKRQPQFRNSFAMGVPVKVLATSFQDEKIDMVICELGRQLPFPQQAAVELLKIIEKVPYPVLLTP